MTKYQDQALEYFRGRQEDFNKWITEYKSDSLLINYGAVSVTYMTISLKKELKSYTIGSQGHHKLTDMLIEVNLPNSDFIKALGDVAKKIIIKKPVVASPFADK